MAHRKWVGLGYEGLTVDLEWPKNHLGCTTIVIDTRPKGFNGIELGRSNMTRASKTVGRHSLSQPWSYAGSSHTTYKNNLELSPLIMCLSVCINYSFHKQSYPTIKIPKYIHKVSAQNTLLLHFIETPQSFLRQSSPHPSCGYNELQCILFTVHKLKCPS